MKKIILVICLLVILMVGIFMFKHSFVKEEKSMPKINLSGSKMISLSVGDKYNEPGYKAFDDKDGDLTKSVKISGSVNCDKPGSYELVYKVKNSDGISAQARRYINVKGVLGYKDSYDKLDNTKRGWWSGNKKDHSRPTGGADINELKKYNAYFMGPNEKVLYLTFDEGGNDTYVKEIVDVLNNNDVKATFFLCGQYILDNKDLIKKMADTGHSVGNHTDNHYSMPTLATREKFSTYLAEIKMIEDSYRDITGKELDKVYRDPRGEWSFRDLQIMKDLGYSSYFYSADYMDFGGDVSKEYALNELMKRYHNGAIYLMHPKNKGNYLALDSFIKEMKKLGYRFDLVKNIP